MRFRSLWLLLGLALVVVLAGCGGQTAPGTTPLPPTTPTVQGPTPLPPTSAATDIPATATPAPPAATPTPRTGAVQYRVQPGDNLSSIAARYAVTVQALTDANDIRDPNLLFAGQVLTIPAPGDAHGASPPPPTTTPVPPATATPVAPATATPIPPATATPVPPTPTLPAGTAIQYTVQPGDGLWRLAQQYDTTVDAIVAHNNLDDPNKILSGTVLTIIVGDHTTRPTPVPTATPRPAPPTPAPGGTGGPKRVDVNISTQMLTAYEGDTVVYQTLVSTGVAAHPTVKGTFHIYRKLLADDMTGGSGADYYYLPAVPYTMYFYEGGYALHGTYWHHNFGHPMSHGCVNLPTDAAQWLFYWAPLGTTVTVH